MNIQATFEFPKPLAPGAHPTDAPGLEDQEVSCIRATYIRSAREFRRAAR